MRRRGGKGRVVRSGKGRRSGGREEGERVVASFVFISFLLPPSFIVSLSLSSFFPSLPPCAKPSPINPQFITDVFALSRDASLGESKDIAALFLPQPNAAHSKLAYSASPFSSFQAARRCAFLTAVARRPYATRSRGMIEVVGVARTVRVKWEW